MERWRLWLLLPVGALLAALAWLAWPRGELPYEPINSPPRARADAGPPRPPRPTDSARADGGPPAPTRPEDAAAPPG